MSIKSIIDVITSDSRPITLVFILAVTLIQVSPIKVNPWTAILGWIGKQLNKDVVKRLDVVESRFDSVDSHLEALDVRLDSVESRLDSVDSQVSSVDTRLTQHITDSELADLEARRKSILDFASSVIRGINFHKEKFQYMLNQCDYYQKYCTENDVKNGVAEASIAEIRRIYQLHLRRNDFLTDKEEVDVTGTFKEATDGAQDE